MKKYLYLLFLLFPLALISKDYVGDINRDGKVDVGDVMALSQMILNNHVNEEMIMADTLLFEQPSLTLHKGQTLNLRIKTVPENASIQHFAWASFNKSIATVSDSVVTARAFGSTQILVLALDGNGAYTLCNLRVVPNPVTGVLLNASDVSLLKGESFSLTASFLPQDADAEDRQIVWTSSNEEAAKVDENGVISAVATGSATITATTPNGKTASCEVSVTNPIISIALNETSLSLVKGENATLSVAFTPADADNMSVIWTSSNEEAAKVDENGNVIAVATGSATITATTPNGKTASCEVCVTNPIVSIALNETSLSLVKGENATLSVAFTPTDADNMSVVWTSSNEEAAKVDENGNVIAVATGSATITATTPNGKTASCEVCVTNPIVCIALNETSLSLTKGENATLSVAFTPADADNMSITWTSSNKKVATVTANGQITAIATGSATITAATPNGKTANCEVSVTNPIVSIALNETSLSLTKGGTATLSVAFTPADADNMSVVWTSSNEEAAKVDENGNVIAVATGSATITATTPNGKTASCEVCVTNPIVSIALNETALSLTKGGTAALSVAFTPADADNMSITWTSSNNNVATVNTNGQVTAIATGSAAITATTPNGKTANCEVSVTNPIVSIALNETSLSLTKGENATLSVAFTPADADNQSITWTSSNNNVATVNTNGQVTAIATGTATITATTPNGKIASCEVSVTNPIVSIALNETSLSLTKGETATLSVAFTPADADNQSITWTSSNRKVATVSANGQITAIATGSATITAATPNGKTANCEVSVTNPIVSIALNETSLSLTKGETATLSVAFTPADADNQSITWTSSNNNVATVNTNGQVTAIATGSATITAATPNGKTANCEVSVTNPIVSIALNETSLSLTKGENATLSVAFTPADADNQSITWTSSNRKVATVTANGQITAIATGSATITATTPNGKTASCEVSVTNPIVSIALNETSLSLTKGETATLSVAFTPADADNQSITWTSSNNNVATVNTNGQITAIATGSAAITATTPNGKTANCEVSVTNPIVSIALNETALSLTKGGTATLSVAFTPADADNQSITWTSSNKKVATVTANGQITAIATGSATITATTPNGKTASCEVSVTNPIVSIALNETALSLTKGGTATLSVAFTPADADNMSVIWTSSNEDAAKVDENGNVIAVATGSATITATTPNGKTASCEVSVTNPIVSIALNETSLSLTKGEDATLSVAFTPADADNMSVVWTSSNNNVATVNTNGQVTAIATGTATITATTPNGKIASCEVCVTNPIVSIALNETSLSLTKGETATLSVAFTPADADNQSITWTSSNNNVATVNTNGQITAIATGSAAITATTPNGKTANCEVSVTNPIVSIALNETALSLTKGGTATLSVAFTPADADNQSITWTSSNKKVATVTANGQITAIATGSATITAATPNGKTASCEVCVTNPIVSIAINETSLSLTKGGTATLSVAFTPADADNQSITWTSSNNNVATVTANGQITAIATGTATITATTPNGKIASCEVCVTNPIVSIALNETSLSLTKGENASLSVAFTPADADNQSITWTSSNRKVATVTANGQITAIATGSATITAATPNGKTANCEVSVTNPIVSIALNETSLSLTKGGTATLSVAFTPADADNQSITWTSSNNNVATVNANGQVMAIATGSTTITASTPNGKTASCEVCVSEPVIPNAPTHIETEAYTNPVFTYDWPDPTVWRGDDGKFYTYSTAGVTYPPSNTNDRRGQFLYSDDMLTWTLPNSTHRVLTNADYNTLYAIGHDFWAPQVIKIQGQWLMYLTVRNSFEDSGIVVLRFNSPTFPAQDGSLGTWQYVRTLVHSKTNGIKDCIDPCVVKDHEDGRLWMFFGSGDGNYRVQMTDDGLALAESNPTYTHVAGLKIGQNSDRSKVFEGAYLYYRAPYWYYFVSSGFYTNSSYRLLVGRSEHLTGTFVDRNGNPMTKGNASILLSANNSEFWGPGHNGEIFTDDNNDDYMFFHSHAKAANKDERRSLMLQQIFWDEEGWPYFKDNQPQLNNNAPFIKN